ncbi:MAG: carboxypeptidase regulatory-like domain-containing protein [Pirellulaceae bacterium]|nr:carboxypeptidase regulatory-like domain-containing protein [Planctomycetales bacterium]MCC7338630.1 carboxypeptidase regulatory-like domain-containing protein [Pirellulaceae bacterium]
MNRLIGSLYRLCFVGFALILFVGCPETSKLVQVTGKITVDGKPANGASVLFFPEGSGGEVAAGSADANGQFTLVSNMEPGIAPGKYKVTVTWPDPAKRPSTEDIAMGRAKDAPDILKGKFVNKDRSTLSVEITATTKELPPLELISK